MKGLPSVTLLTDFGWRDPWLAEVKGALFSQWARWPCPLTSIPVVDLAHDIDPGDIAAASWFLERVWLRWPPGTVHLAVVDPGVGSDRPALACSSAGRFLVGPGNGLFRFLEKQADLEIVLLDEPLYHGGTGGEPVSSTFHGRDVFAPVAGQLAAGVALSQLGSLTGVQALGPQRGLGDGAARLVWIDRFGNGISNLARESSQAAALEAGGQVLVAGTPVPGPFSHFSAAADVGVFWFWGSGQTLEIAMTGGRASDILGLKPGLELEVQLP